VAGSWACFRNDLSADLEKYRFGPGAQGQQCNLFHAFRDTSTDPAADRLHPHGGSARFSGFSLDFKQPLGGGLPSNHQGPGSLRHHPGASRPGARFDLILVTMPGILGLATAIGGGFEI